MLKQDNHTKYFNSLIPYITSSKVHSCSTWQAFTRTQYFHSDKLYNKFLTEIKKNKYNYPRPGKLTT